MDFACFMSFLGIVLASTLYAQYTTQMPSKYYIFITTFLLHSPKAVPSDSCNTVRHSCQEECIAGPCLMIVLITVRRRRMTIILIVTATRIIKDSGDNNNSGNKNNE